MRIFPAQVFALILIAVTGLMAQTRVHITPGSFEFEGAFQRLRPITISNTGTTEVRVDSLVYNSGRFFVKVNNSNGLPVTLHPSDTLKLDCILLSSALISSKDVADSLLIYSNAATQPYKVNIKIYYFDDDAGRGYVTGKVSDNTAAISGVKLFFFYEGKYLLDSAKTNLNGEYSIRIPQGEYVVGAELPGYFLTFSGNATNFFKALPVHVSKDSTSTANIIMTVSPATSVSISGSVRDALTNASLKKGIVIIHHGTHTPGSVNKVSALDTLSFTGLIAADGTYKVDNLPAGSYYRIQVFSDFYMPGYYTNSGQPAILWQESDSVDAVNGLTAKNINLESDSCYGAGQASGSLGSLMKVSGNIPGALVLAHSLTNDHYYSYGISDASGGFTVKELPYGTYELVAQRIGQADMVSSPFVIDNINKSYRSLILQPLSTKKEQNISPSEYLILNNYPNPFNPSTNISYSLPEAGMIHISIFNLAGQKVKDLFSGQQVSGEHRINFTATGLSSGTYFVVLRTNKYSIVRKILLMK